MRKTLSFLLCCLLVSSFAVGAAPKSKNTKPQKTVYCWDENGQRRCGDFLPPEASEAARTERSTKGYVKREVDRALTPEEIRVKEQEARLLQQQEAQTQEAQRRVQSLLAVYPTENELLRSLVDEENEIKNNIQLLIHSQKILRQNLVNRLEIVGNMELLGKTPSPAQLDLIQKAREPLLKNQQSIASFEEKQKEYELHKQKLLEEYRAAKNQQIQQAQQLLPASSL